MFLHLFHLLNDRFRSPPSPHPSPHALAHLHPPLRGQKESGQPAVESGFAKKKHDVPLALGWLVTGAFTMAHPNLLLIYCWLVVFSQTHLKTYARQIGFIFPKFFGVNIRKYFELPPTRLSPPGFPWRMGISPMYEPLKPQIQELYLYRALGGSIHDL